MDESQAWIWARVLIPLSFLSIGGGNSIVAEMKRQTVNVHHWMTAGQFVDLWAISRASPGPGSLLVSLIGFQLGGVVGAFVAALAIFTPTTVLVYVIARIWRRHSEAPWRGAIERGLAPVAAGLILASVATLLRSIEGGVMAWIVTAASFVVLRTLRVSPLLMLAVGAIVFAVVGSFWWPG